MLIDTSRFPRDEQLPVLKAIAPLSRVRAVRGESRGYLDQPKHGPTFRHGNLRRTQQASASLATNFACVAVRGEIWWMISSRTAELGERSNTLSPHFHRPRRRATTRRIDQTDNLVSAARSPAPHRRRMALMRSFESEVACGEDIRARIRDFTLGQSVLCTFYGNAPRRLPLFAHSFPLKSIALLTQLKRKWRWRMDKRRPATSGVVDSFIDWGVAIPSPIAKT